MRFHIVPKTRHQMEVPDQFHQYYTVGWQYERVTNSSNLRDGTWVSNTCLYDSVGPKITMGN